MTVCNFGMISCLEISTQTCEMSLLADAEIIGVLFCI